MPPPAVASAITDIVVVVPAHNEQVLLPSCLAALDAAVAGLRQSVQVIVVLDSCDDDSAGAVPDHVTTLHVTARCVGAARRAGFAAASPTPADTTWFATTDADSAVPPDWLLTHVEAADSGADAFVGIVTPDGFDGWPRGIGSMFDARYDARPGHRHVHGANLGIRATAYAAAGGFRELDAHEDVDLVRRLEDSAVPIVWGADAPVRTSTRRIGRTVDGFASYLRELTDQAPEASR
ncbi:MULTISPECIES: glycosyltransferase [Gordonia]|jgi:glycosyltransferase involved in cell wall biosynthesis|uniref:4,4'-diaponeurosporenoate glycosyltransferase n=2 Tax=Gordonia alkanivorans TaxID=84096 RepID=F9VVQ0_9ACTN|nr:glycosyl transferase [Gordonia alkanivorans]ETA07722.1 glycosyl transferase [Gordonia alkanivorans CGMCC 6845]OLT51620.1 glycosyl transferase [Gordonia sp. CNJ-863]GAA12679.1 putative glycosyltransferase [Gordonia alkanivorans NBRC 16433]